MPSNTPQVSPYIRSYNSFSGVDIKAVFGNKTIGELQAISYSITREKAPIYTMGSADPRAFSRGKRGIAGTLIFIVFDRHALLSQLADPTTGLRFLSDKDDIRPNYRTSDDGDAFSSTVGQNSNPSAEPAIAARAESDLESVASDQELAVPWYVDQLPPFDVTLAAANEYGSLAVMKVFGVELLNEGYGVSIDDIVSEQQMTYVARSILPWTPVSSASPNFLNEIARGGSTGE